MKGPHYIISERRSLVTLLQATHMDYHAEALLSFEAPKILILIFLCHIFPRCYSLLLLKEYGISIQNYILGTLINVSQHFLIVSITGNAVLNIIVMKE